MLDKNLVADVLIAALECGGDFAELFVENNQRNNISLVNGVVDKASGGIEHGAGIRIFDGLNAVYSYTCDTSRESLVKLAQETAKAAKSRRNLTLPAFAGVEYLNAHPAKIAFTDIEKPRVVTMLKEAHLAAISYNAQVTQTTVNYLDSTQEVLIANSDGLWAEDHRPRTRILVNAVASSETEKQSGYIAPGGLCGFEFYDNIDPKSLGIKAATTAVTMLNAGLCPSGKMPVIIDNGFGGVIFHEACGHSLEATSVARNASVFAGKLGQRIASDVVSAVDDGTLPNKWGSINIDDEGIPGRRNLLIENGILKGYLIDRLNGQRMGMAPTGSSRRESYRFAPTSRMTNTFILPGKDRIEDIIADTEYGLYAKNMGGGSVEPATGSFNFAVLEGYMVRGGKICEPVRGATLIGKGSEILLNIDRVSDNLALAPGMCGSISGSVPTTVGQPMIRVQNITVGGRS